MSSIKNSIYLAKVFKNLNLNFKQVRNADAAQGKLNTC